MNRRARLRHLAVVGWLLSYPLSALALGIALFSLFGIADPSGTQMADDGDPLARIFHEGTRMIATGFAPESRREKE